MLQILKTSSLCCPTARLSPAFATQMASGRTSAQTSMCFTQLGARTLLVAPGHTISNKKLLGTKGIATRSKKLLLARRLKMCQATAVQPMISGLAHDLKACHSIRKAAQPPSRPVSPSTIHIGCLICASTSRMHSPNYAKSPRVNSMRSGQDRQREAELKQTCLTPLYIHIYIRILCMYMYMYIYVYYIYTYIIYMAQGSRFRLKKGD